MEHLHHHFSPSRGMQVAEFRCGHAFIKSHAQQGTYGKVIEPDDVVLVGAGVLANDELVVSAHHGQVVGG